MLCTQPRQVFRGARCLAHLLSDDKEDRQAEHSDAERHEEASVAAEGAERAEGGGQVRVLLEG